MNEKLRDARGENSDADPEAEAAARSVEEPPQPDRQRRQRKRELQVVREFDFLSGGEGPSLLRAICWDCVSVNKVSKTIFGQIFTLCLQKIFFYRVFLLLSVFERLQKRAVCVRKGGGGGETASFDFLCHESVWKGYSAGVVDSDEYCDASHDAGPLAAVLVLLP